MPTEHTNHDSDSEDDAEYIPPEEGSDSSDDEPVSKHARTTSPPPQEQDEHEKKQERDALWAAFQSSVNTPLPIQQEVPKEKIKVERHYRFAGEDFVEVVEVDADSPDAKKWHAWRIPLPIETGTSDVSSLVGGASASNSSTVNTPISTDATVKPIPRRPGPRKSKISLSALPTPSSTKAKKLTTLDKSVMDWNAHIQSSGNPELKDELDANRRGGGYLEKVEFLKRVDERKDDVIEASKSSKRRRL